MATREQETWWVLRAQTGDREALDALLGSVEAPLLRYVAGMVGERAAAEDVVQETFIRIYRKLGWLEEPALFRAWAYRIATREAFRLLKRERRWTDQVRDEAVLEALPAPGADEGLATELAERLPALLDRVSPASRAVLELHYLHDMRLGEVAAVLELPVGTVKSRLAYGLAALRRALVETGKGG
jgi:RNA polymerase sigma-70 factor (ECF subfamily)